MRADAFHEAGHAAVAMALGFMVTQIEIRGRGEYAGGTEIVPPEVPPEEDITILLAGLEAQARHLGVEPRVVANTGHDDMQMIRLIAEEQKSKWPADPSRFDRLRRDCRRLIECHWPLIEAIADRLMQTKKLDAVAILRLQADAKHAAVDAADDPTRTRRHRRKLAASMPREKKDPADKSRSS